MAGTTDTVKAILTPGEFVIRKEAVDMIGVPTLEKLNDMPEAGGHSEIDRLIGMATLKNMTGMYGGGEVKTQQYGHGGQVHGYQDGGKTIDVNKYADWAKSVGLNPAYMDTSDSSIVVSTPEQSKMFDDITSKIMFPPKTSKTQQIDIILDMLNTPQYYGLGMGDSVPSSDFLLNRRAQAEKDREEVKAAEKIYNEMNWLEKKKVFGYQDGGAVQDDAMMQQFLQQQQMMQQPQQGGNGFVPFDQRQPGAAASGSWGEPGAYMESLRANRDSLQQAAEQARLDSARQSLEAIKLDSLIRSLGKEGGAVEEKPKGSGYLFPDAFYEGGERIESKPEGNGFLYNDFEQQKIPAGQFSNDRNMIEFLKQQLMQRGEGALKQGMGENLDLMFQ